MQAYPLISVIIPVYNAEKYLPKCIESVLQQTYSNLEIIMVDDGSQDNSVSIIESYQARDSRIKLITQKNSGVSAARNTGIRNATGEYIGFVDSDDWIDSGMYETLLELLDKNNAEISSVEINRVFDEQDIPTSKPGIEKVYSQEEYAKRFFKIGSQEILYYCYNKLYKNSCVSQDMFPNYKVGEDVISTYKAILKATKIVTSDLKMYYYRQGTGITAQFNENYLKLVNVWDEVYKLSQENKLAYCDWALINQQRIRFTLLSELALSGKYKENTEIRDDLLLQLKASKKDLLKSDISLSRKILIIMFCFDYKHTAWLLSKMNIRRQ